MVQPEDYLESAVTKVHAEAFQKILSRHEGLETIFIDSAAAQFGADLAYTYDIATTKADKAVLEGINYVQNLVENNKVKVLRNCVHVLSAFDQYQWDTSGLTQKEKPDHAYSDIADAIRYAIYTFTV